MTDETTVTLHVPGMAPVTTNLEMLKKATKRVKDGAKTKGQTEAFGADEMGAEAAAQKADAELKQIIERIERMEEEKKAVADDIRDIYAEAKGRGFDVKALRTIVRLRAMDTADREELESIVELYKSALGMG